MNSDQKEEKIEVAILKAWRNYYGNIAHDIVPPLHPFFDKAFRAGVEFVKAKEKINEAKRQRNRAD